jgi:hypothetical protein
MCCATLVARRWAWRYLIELLSWWASPAPLQGFEFESTFLLSIAMFTMIGVLPVLPGPCQLVWWKHIRNVDGPLDL